MASQIPEYFSSESDSDSNAAGPASKRIRLPQSWTLIATFNAPAEAESAVKSEETWSKYYKNTTEEGVKQYYRCNKTKYKGQQCFASTFLLYESTSSKILLFKNEHAHDHDQTGNLAAVGISDESKEVIKNCFGDRRKPKYIMEQLASKQLPLPKMFQLKNYLNLLRKEKYGSPQISVGELEIFLRDNSACPDYEDTPFVVAYEITDEVDIEFRFFVTTKRLLTYVATAKKIHADATYKLCWQGFPVLIVGTTDMDRKFHHFGLAVTTNEKAEDFAFMFKALKSGVKEHVNMDLQPDVLISDASQAIRNGFAQIFGEEIIVVMCWAHMRKNTVKKIEKYCPKNLRPQIMEDLDQLQLSSTKEIFVKALSLFLEKWSSEEEFIKYFKEEWILKNPNWYEGVIIGVPSTNNALEASNRVIKDEHTLRERVPLNQFKILVLEMVNKWSSAYANGLKKIENRPTITLNTWISAYNWVKENKKGESTVNEKYIFYRLPGGDNITISDDLKPIKDWTSFEDYSLNAFAIWTVAFPKENTEENWIDGQCNCPAYLKKMQCKHITGMAIRLKYVKPPVEAKAAIIGQKKKRGRPSKIKKALIIE